jgi:Nuclease-related domain
MPAGPPAGSLGSPGRLPAPPPHGLAARRPRERRTARLLDRLTRDGYVIFHDLAVPGSPANVDHLVIGPTGLFVVDSKQWTGALTAYSLLHNLRDPSREGSRRPSGAA